MREPQLRGEPSVRFLHEQDGGPERSLKAALHELLASRSGVARAYLARVDYGNASASEVALCVTGPENPTLVREVAATFAKQFGRDAHLDILFLNVNQEAELKRVCSPFYEAG